MLNINKGSVNIANIFQHHATTAAATANFHSNKMKNNNDNCNNTKRICGAEANATTDPFHTQKLLRLNNMFLVIVEMNQMK